MFVIDKRKSSERASRAQPGPPSAVGVRSPVVATGVVTPRDFGAFLASLPICPVPLSWRGATPGPASGAETILPDVSPGLPGVGGFSRPPVLRACALAEK